MAKIASEWVFLKCPACSGVLKVSNGIQTDRIVCPSCHEAVDMEAAEKLPAAAVNTAAVQAASHLPSGRTVDPEPAFARGQVREEWQRGGDPHRSFDLKGKLRSSSDPDLRYDPENPPMKRVSLRRKQREVELTSFETEERPPPEERRTKKHKTTGAKDGRLIYWLTGAVAALAIAVVWMGWNYVSGKDSAAKETARKAPDDPLSVERDSMTQHLPAIRKVIERFAGAEKVDDFLPVLRDRERVEPAVRAWYSGNNPWKKLQLRPFEAGALGPDGRFVAVAVESVSFDVMQFALEHTGAEGFLLDWEAFTGWGEMPWSELGKKMPKEPVLVRAVITMGVQGSRALYYDDAFAEKDFICLKLSDLREDNVIYAYTPRSSKLAEQFAAAAVASQPNAAGDAQFRGIVRVKYPEKGVNPRQVEMVEFLERGWVFRSDRSVELEKSTAQAN